jgi:CPA2 family monovalent cation:H+ antiporter-2
LVPVLAAGATPLLADLGVLVVAAALIAYVCQRIGLIPIVGFLLSGILIGPNGLGLVDDLDLVNQAADLGVILLLFTIGIEFSLSRLRQLAVLILGGGSLQVGITTAITMGICVAFGVDWKTALFTGFLVALSSTAIVLKLLADNGTTATPSGKVTFGFLIFQDLAIVAMVLVVPMLGGDSEGFGELGWAIAKAVGIIVVVLAAARTLMPRLLDAVARTCSSEVFLLTIIGVCFGTAYLTSLADVSVSLGAFLAGLVVSESRLSGQALSDILPLQILFSATFFVSVGMLLDLGYLFDEVFLVIGLAAVVVVVKVLGSAAAALALRKPWSVVAGSSLTLAQIGEFSFVLERVGADAGLVPAGLEGGSQAFIAVTVVLMIATPFLADAGDRLGGRLDDGRLPVPLDDDDVPVHGHREMRDHVVIVGFGPTARAVARALDLIDMAYVITTADPDAGRGAELDGRKVVQGDITRRYIFELAGVARARLVVIPDDDAERVHQVAALCHASSSATVLARSLTSVEAHELQETGLVEHVVADETASTDALLSHVLGWLALPERLVDAVVEDVLGTATLREAASVAMAPGMIVRTHIDGEACDHVDRIRAVTPGAAGCEECLRDHDRWVHLRLCLVCGHVGCCDSSPRRHARSHHAETGHPIARSMEVGEYWAWCYEHRITLNVEAREQSTPGVRPADEPDLLP